MNDFHRYSRQLAVPGFSPAAQERLCAARVLIVGAGGLGAPVAAQLLAAGTGTTTIIDFDKVDLSNLHRQWLYTEAQIGQPKVDVLKSHLISLNSTVDVVAVNQRLGPDNVDLLVGAADLVVDAADNFAASYLLSDTCFKRKVPLLTASVNQRFGYICLLCANGAPSLRAVFPSVPRSQTSCDVAGVSGPAVSAVAAFQAQIALDWLAGVSQNMSGRVLYIDLRDYSLRMVNCGSAAEPEKPQIDLISARSILPDDRVIDVRRAEEITAQPQTFAVQYNLPLDEFTPQAVREPASRLVFACQSGQRALVAAQMMQKAGHPKLAVVLP